VTHDIAPAVFGGFKVSSLILNSEMQLTTDKLDRRIRELELIVAVYSAALELYKDEKKAESTNPARPESPLGRKEFYPNGSTG
jgi:hypothetical protein